MYDPAYFGRLRTDSTASSSSSETTADPSSSLSWSDASDHEDVPGRPYQERRPLREDASISNYQVIRAKGQLPERLLQAKTYIKSESLHENEPIFIARRRPQSAWSRAPSVQHPKTLHRTAFEVRLFDDFWKLYLPQSESAQPRQSLGFLIPAWTEVLRDYYYQQSDAVRLAFLAVCMARVGRHSQQRRMVEEGMKQYGRALFQTNAILGDRAKAQSEITPLACQLCGVYEVSLISIVLPTVLH